MLPKIKTQKSRIFPPSRNPNPNTRLTVPPPAFLSFPFLPSRPCFPSFRAHLFVFMPAAPSKKRRNAQGSGLAHIPVEVAVSILTQGSAVTYAQDAFAHLYAIQDARNGQQCRDNCTGNGGVHCVCAALPRAGAFRKKGVWKKVPPTIAAIDAELGDVQQQGDQDDEQERDAAADSTEDAAAAARAPQNDSSTPTEEAVGASTTNRSKNAPCGLQNLGATCYMNAAVQCFFADRAFRRELYAAAGSVIDEAVTTEDDDTPSKNVAVGLAQLFATMQLRLSWQSYIDPAFFASLLELETGVQQDGAEFSTLLLQLLERDVSCLRDQTMRRIVASRFRGWQSNTTRCLGCNRTSEASASRVPFYELPLEISAGCTTLDASFARLLGIEMLDDGQASYQCGHCGQRCAAQRQLVIRELPRALNLHLQRFVFDLQTLARKKVGLKYRFPSSFPASALLEPSGLENVSSAGTYRLRTILCHRGTNATSGHYVARTFIVGDGDEAAWWKLDDREATCLGNNPFGDRRGGPKAKKANGPAAENVQGDTKVDGTGDGDGDGDGAPPAKRARGANRAPSEIRDEFESDEVYLLTYVLDTGDAVDFAASADTDVDVANVEIPKPVASRVAASQETEKQRYTELKSRRADALTKVEKRRNAMRAAIDACSADTIPPHGDGMWVPNEWIRAWCDTEAAPAAPFAPKVKQSVEKEVVNLTDVPSPQKTTTVVDLEAEAQAKQQSPVLETTPATDTCEVDATPPAVELVGPFASASAASKKKESMAVLCAHGHLDPRAAWAGAFRRIPKSAWQQILELDGDAWDLQHHARSDAQAWCPTCATAVLSAIVGDGVASERHKEISEMLDAYEMQSAEERDGVYVSRSWLRSWREQSQVFRRRGPLEGIICQHGKLRPEAEGADARRAEVPKAAWQMLRTWKDHAATTAIGTTDASVEPFPVGMPECADCVASEDARRAIRGAQASQRSWDRALAPSMLLPNGLELLVGERACVLPPSFSRAWTSWITHRPDAARPTRSDYVTACLSARCPHGRLFVPGLRPDAEGRLPVGRTKRAKGYTLAAGEAGLCAVQIAEYKAIVSSLDDAGVGGTEACDGSSLWIEVSDPRDLSSQQQNVVAANGSTARRGTKRDKASTVSNNSAATSASSLISTAITTPLACVECAAEEVKELEAVRAAAAVPMYDSGRLTVTYQASTPVASSVAAVAATAAATPNSRVRRRGANVEQMSVSSATTLRDVRLHLCQVFRVHPDEQVLVSVPDDGTPPRALDGDGETMGALGLNSCSRLVLYPREGKNRQAPDDLADYLQRTAEYASADGGAATSTKATNAVERGFAGSRLVGGVNNQDTWTCGTCTFINVVSSRVCDMCDMPRA